ncbi:MAG: hypothetical protein AB7U98_09335 [Candidatus Nitrosocosmicus sp.]
MAAFYSSSRSNIFPLAITFIMGVEILLLIGSTNEKPLLSIVLAQELSEQITNYSNISLSKSLPAENISIKQNDSKKVTASGHFANNQMKDGIVTWIQGGFWNLKIDNSSNITKSAIFNANFTMIRPDGSLDHNHVINNFKSTIVIFAGNDIVITGISDINSNNGTEYEDVPLTIHLMGKKVLGLMIDVNKTDGHFSGSNEMYGTLISGIGLDNSTSINNTPIMNSHTAPESKSTLISNPMTHASH